MSFMGQPPRVRMVPLIVWVIQTALEAVALVLGSEVKILVLGIDHEWV